MQPRRAVHIWHDRSLSAWADLGAHLYLCGPSMQHFKVAPDDLIIDGLPQVEYPTFVSVMERADIHLYC